MLSRLRPSHPTDAADWSAALDELRCAKHVAWLPDCVDPEAPWGFETRPLVLFGEEETDKLDLPPVDLFVYSDPSSRLWEDVQRCYGPEEELRGNRVVHRSDLGFGERIEVELAEIIPIAAWDGDLSASLHGRMKAERRWPTPKRTALWAAALLRFECSYEGGDHEDEEHLVLYAPYAAGVVIDQVLPRIARSPDTVLLAERSASIVPHVVSALRPKQLLVQRPCEEPAGYTSHSAVRATSWGGMVLLRRAGR